MPEPKRPLKVFLCHAHADRDRVRALYARLTKDGVDAWLDKEKLLPGQDWELEIRKAVREADVVVVCLSKQFNQAGFRQQEVRWALDTAMKQPEDEIFIIPARLEECENLENLRRWHWVDLFEDDGYEMLMRALRTRANKIDATLQVKKSWPSKPTLPQSKNEKSSGHTFEYQTPEEKNKPVVDKGIINNASPFLREEKPQKVESRKSDNQSPTDTSKNAFRYRVLIVFLGIVAIAIVMGLLSLKENLLVNPASDVFNPYPDSSDYVDTYNVPMRLIPAGEYWVGNNTGASDDEKPVHKIYLDSFYIDKFEVTNRLYKICVDTGICTSPQETNSYTRPTYYVDSQFDNFPVIYVDWNMAKIYCEWRSARLPTEAEWETAASTNRRTYPWGEGISKTFANYNNDLGDTVVVGSYGNGISAYKLYDMAGNVWEWVADWYGSNYYLSLSDGVLNPQGPQSGQTRVLKGGSWASDSESLRSAHRFSHPPDYVNYTIGFRCARSAP